jgi:putative chitinase
MINRKFFFDYIRPALFGGKLKQSQVNGMTVILDQWEASRNTDDRRLAYILATAYHETGKAMQPVPEVGKGRGKKYGKPHPLTGKVYYGRGHVQLTWFENYERMGRKLGIDLVHNPDLALDTEVSAKILFLGMMEGLFTGKKLGDYFSADKEDWVNARRIVNGTDRAKDIAEYALIFYAGLSHK